MELPQVQDFEASKLGTKSYWDTVYDRENKNFQEIGDIGEIWFGEESVERMVEWVTEHVSDMNCRTVDLGCGNGHLLIELHEAGYKSLHGIDYSESAIQLATSIASERQLAITYQTVDFLSNPQWFQQQYDLVLDKGTYDAISLHPDQIKAKQEGVPGPREKYIEAVYKMIKPKSGLFLITSCNWTKEELIENFKQYFRYHSNVKYPVFQFGGHTGSKICTVAFTPI
ncbi:S-adenosyl-L-methionine-dependent methyltransferase [Cokeromyces recurvatus]|uniref:S-adenosyl-L-methionine-dependent methyltransferase n=1 Tax=Cokeromyces recurvatus TaxID=90255 RepID=UPI00221E3820|nr:S-adenosyl-L-methionine-dependent methyltransferase [Cokeromyces recurvatus]KAI7904353.1 S-adenosyl-L-methionine-dependent methyltransferase [Cokeromyces recurvatus]